LGEGRKDESGDFTKGAGLPRAAIDEILNVFGSGVRGSSSMSTIGSNTVTLANLEDRIGKTATGASGMSDLKQIIGITERSAYGSDRILVDPSVVRGLDYYTGAVFEAQLIFPIPNEEGEDVIFGSIAGGGRYDDLVARFTGQQVPATGISIGVSRLLTALTTRGLSVGKHVPFVFVTVMDDVTESFRMAAELRQSGFRAEAYTGNKKLQDQLKYADKRGAAIAVIEGGDERARGEVTLKDLALGAELAKSVESRADWVANREAQKSVPRARLVAEVQAMLKGRPGENS
jgi:histidyl-tRNA synthetase